MSPVKQDRRISLSEALARRADPKGVRFTYEKWPSLASEGFRVETLLPEGDFERACLMGMGGSAAGGDILSGWLAGNGGPELFVWKGGPPTRSFRGTLAIACSASGETSETIEMLKTAVGHGATAVSISAGGTLMRVSRELGVQHIMMPEVVAPRYMLPFMTFACLSVLNRGLGLRCEEEARDALQAMESEGPDLGIGSEPPRNASKALALDLLGKAPVIYGTAVTRGVGLRFKNALNENAKLHAYFDGVPDTFHNEIESWEGPSTGFHPLFLRHPMDGARDSRRMDSMAEILASRGVMATNLAGRGSSSLAKLVTLAYGLDMTSYYLAIASGTDPLPTRLIDRLKR